MFPDFSLDTPNLCSEVSMAPSKVTPHIQIESVDVGEGRNRDSCASLVVVNAHAEEDNHRRHKWLDTMIERNPTRHFIIHLRYELQFYVVSIIHQFSPTILSARGKN